MADEDASMQLAVVLSPTTHALLRLVTTIRSRGADISELRWSIPEGNAGEAFLEVACAPQRHDHMQAVIERIVDVRQVTRLDAGSARSRSSAYGMPTVTSPV